MSRIPPEAKAEINSILAENMEISAAELVSVLDRYEVREDPAVLQRRRLSASGIWRASSMRMAAELCWPCENNMGSRSIP